MKWKNKGHEFDEFMTTFSEEFHKKYMYLELDS